MRDIRIELSDRMLLSLGSLKLIIVVTCISIILTHHNYLETRKRVIGKQCSPDQTPHDVGSDQGLHCFLTGN